MWRRLLDQRRGGRVQLAARDLVRVDRLRRDVALVVELDRTTDPGLVVAADERVHVRVAGVSSVDPGQEDVRGVVGLGGVQTRVLAVDSLVLRVEVSRGRSRRSRQDGAVGGLCAGRRHERRVLRAVARHEQALEAGLAQLLAQQPALGVVPGVEDRVGGRGRHLGDGRAEVRLVLLYRVLADHGRSERRLDEAGQTHAVVLVVVDEVDLLGVRGVLHVLHVSRTLDAVVADHAVPGGPALLGDGGVGGRGRDRGQAGGGERLAGRERLTGEARTHQADDRGVLDDLGRQRSGLHGVALGVEGLEAYLAVAVGLVVLVKGELDAADHVLAERAGRTRGRSQEGDLLSGRAAGAGRGG